MIYFIRNLKSGAIKIGVAANPKCRLRQLQTGSGGALEIIREGDWPKPTEQWLHKRYQHLRLIGEWFEFDDDMLVVEPPENARIKKPKKKPAGKSPITPHTLAVLVSGALKSEWFGDGDAASWIQDTAALAGVSERTLQGHFYGETAPRLDHFIRYALHLGPTFAAHVMQPAGLACVRMEDAAALDMAAVIKMLRTAPKQMRGLADDLDDLRATAIPHEGSVK